MAERGRTVGRINLMKYNCRLIKSPIFIHLSQRGREGRERVLSKYCIKSHFKEDEIIFTCAIEEKHHVNNELVLFSLFSLLPLVFDDMVVVVMVTFAFLWMRVVQGILINGTSSSESSSKFNECFTQILAS